LQTSNLAYKEQHDTRKWSKGKHSSEKCLIINKTPTCTMCNDPGHGYDLTNTECPGGGKKQKKKKERERESKSKYLFVSSEIMFSPKHNTPGK
jgi:hypothetical protein